MFKTIKSRVIFVIVFCLICLAITTGAIIYKNIEIDETEGAKKEEARLQEDTVKGVNLKGTYNQNDLSISEKRATKEKIEITFCQIDGLKDADMQNKINKELEVVAINSYKEQISDLDKVLNVFVNTTNYSNFANVLSFSVDYTSKIDDNGDGFYQGHKFLNYDLTTGEKITFDKLFTSNAPIEEILRKSSYYSLVQRNLQNNLSGDMVVSNYGDVEDDVALIIDKYKKGKITEFYFSPTEIFIQYDNDTLITINMQEYSDYIAIYNRYLTNESIYEKNDIGNKNLYTLAEDYRKTYQYSDYEKESNYFIDVNMLVVTGKEDIAVETFKQQKINQIKKEIENIKHLAYQNSDNFYILNYNIYVFAADDSGLGQTYLQCTTKGNTYEMTVHDFEENVEPIIIKTNREYSGGDIPEYIYDFTDILKVGPQNIDEYFNPETGEKIVI